MLCIFDVNETLLDLAALDEFFVERFGEARARIDWFDLLIYSALTVTAAGGYEQFGTLAATTLARLGEQRARPITEDDRTALGQSIASLPAHPDVRPAFDRLRSAGCTVVTLTNSTAQVAHEQLGNAGLREAVDAVHSVDSVQQLKPGRAPYEYVLREHGVNPVDAIFVAAHDWDIAGAAAAGLRTAYVDRGRAWRLGASVRPAVSVRDLDELAEQIVTSAP